MLSLDTYNSYGNAYGVWVSAITIPDYHPQFLSLANRFIAYEYWSGIVKSQKGIYQGWHHPGVFMAKGNFYERVAAWWPVRHNLGNRSSERGYFRNSGTL